MLLLFCENVCLLNQRLFYQICHTSKKSSHIFIIAVFPKMSWPLRVWGKHDTIKMSKLLTMSMRVYQFWHLSDTSKDHPDKCQQRRIQSQKSNVSPIYVIRSINSLYIFISLSYIIYCKITGHWRGWGCFWW